MCLNRVVIHTMFHSDYRLSWVECFVGVFFILRRLVRHKVDLGRIYIYIYLLRVYGQLLHPTLKF